MLLSCPLYSKHFLFLFVYLGLLLLLLVVIVVVTHARQVLFNELTLPIMPSFILAVRFESGANQTTLHVILQVIAGSIMGNL